jgi:hypothetical protein
MSHIVLLGDSIFDNASYVPGGPSVIDHLLGLLPSGWRATLLATDGDMTPHVAEQLARLPGDATHLVLSVGGNDALSRSGEVLLEERASFVEVLSRLSQIGEEFRNSYRQMLDAVLAHGKPTTVCTVYDSIPGLGRAERAGLCVFNDGITRVAFQTGVDVIDLRLICNEPGDYSSLSPIEPSAAGGGKIARAIVRALTEGGRTRASRVIV